jgi:hypothetical protein
MGYDVDEQYKSEWNMGVATLQRIDRILRELDEMNYSDEYISRFFALKTLWREIRPLADNKERLLHANHLDKCVWVNDILQTTPNKVPKTALKVFDDWEEDLRDFIHSHDMFIPKKQDPRYAMG